MNQIARKVNLGGFVGIEDITMLNVFSDAVERGVATLSRVADDADTLAKSYERLGDE